MEFLQIAIMYLLSKCLNNTCERAQFLVKLCAKNL